jgi:hypothetical protein
MQLKSGDALIVVDVQRDFLRGGSLAVPHGDEVIPAINAAIAQFQSTGLPVVATRDWHPPDHCSFVAQGGSWPPHCIKDTPGADFPEQLDLPDSTMPRLRNAGINIQGVRLDSGDLIELSRRTREILDQGGASHIRIFASGGLNELELLRITQVGAPIDGFGVGTDLDVSSDAPYLDCAYKLQEYDGRACRKRSTGKSTWPGRKQIFRRFDTDGLANRDVVGLENESICGEALLLPLMLHGERLQAPPALTSIREFAVESVATLPDSLRTLTAATQYPIEISAGIRALAAEVDSRTR